MNLDAKNSSVPAGHKSSAERKSATAPATPVTSHPNPLSDR